MGSYHIKASVCFKCKDNIITSKTILNLLLTFFIDCPLKVVGQAEGSIVKVYSTLSQSGKMNITNSQTHLWTYNYFFSKVEFVDVNWNYNMSRLQTGSSQNFLSSSLFEDV